MYRSLERIMVNDLISLRLDYIIKQLIVCY